MREKVLYAVLGILAVVVAIYYAGCSPSVELGELSGTVTYKGKPPSQGTRILFISEDRRWSIAPTLKSDGTYRVSVEHGWGLPPGKYKVAILAPPDATVKYPDIPVKYRDPETSKLTMELTVDGKVYDVDMK